jgi:hypothetical protein
MNDIDARKGLPKEKATNASKSSRFAASTDLFVLIGDLCPRLHSLARGRLCGVV